MDILLIEGGVFVSRTSGAREGYDMGLRISPIVLLAAEEVSAVRGAARGAVRSNAVSADRPPDARAVRVSEIATEAARAVNLAQDAVESLLEIERRLDAIRDEIAEAGGRVFLREAELVESQLRIARNVITINVIVAGTRLFGITVLGGSVTNETFNITPNEPLNLTIPNLAADQLGRGVSNQTGIENLSQIDIARFPPGVRLPRGLTDAFLVAGAAIEDAARVREGIERFEGEVFSSAFRELRAERRALGVSDAGFREIDSALAPSQLALSELLRQANLIALRADLDLTGELLNLVI